ncbi:MAG: hypothetical protein U5L96_12855 [Owenweeksia sp.]|nr:hypothetical protein [Owenweeksia sp.]
MKKLISLTLFLLASSSAIAQNFSKTYKINPLSQINSMVRAEEAVEALPMADGGYLIAGHMNTVPNAGYPSLRT